MRTPLDGLFYSGIIGAGGGYAVSRTWLPAWRRLPPAVGAVILVLASHGLEDTAVAIVISVVPLLVLLVILWWARRDARGLSETAG